MNDKPSPEISPELIEGCPYLAEDYASQDAHDASQSEDVYNLDGSLKYEGLSHADAMRILKKENIPGERVTRYSTSRDSFLDYL